MIKGVTKSIIEIIPKNSCFEKVIVILNKMRFAVRSNF